jgi:hypothetical protein
MSGARIRSPPRKTMQNLVPDLGYGVGRHAAAPPGTVRADR